MEIVCVVNIPLKCVNNSASDNGVSLGRGYLFFELFENITFGVQFGELSDKDIT